MEIAENSFSLRGMNGLVKIASDSAFEPAGGASGYADEAECDLIVESAGFRVNKVVIMSMPPIARFLREVRTLIDRGEGAAGLGGPGEELFLSFRYDRGRARVECAMSDSREGNENSLSVKYWIEPDYLAALKREFARAGLYSGGAG